MTDLDLQALVRRARVIAVLGAHDDPSRAANYVPRYMHEHGVRVVPVNPRLAGRQLFGENVRATLAEIREPIDIVDVFRRPADLAAHLPDLLAMNPPPPIVWLQTGIRDDDFARAVQERGIAVVQDRCLMVEHRRLASGDAASR